MKEQRKEKKDMMGLKRLRKNGSKTVYHCGNCNCDRYAPCGCTKSEKPRETN